jgi:hypothetical protein
MTSTTSSPGSISCSCSTSSSTSTATPPSSSSADPRARHHLDAARLLPEPRSRSGMGDRAAPLTLDRARDRRDPAARGRRRRRARLDRRRPRPHRAPVNREELAWAAGFFDDDEAPRGRPQVARPFTTPAPSGCSTRSSRLRPPRPRGDRRLRGRADLQLDGVLVTATPRRVEELAREVDVVVTHLDRTRQAVAAAEHTGRPLVHLVHNDRQLQFTTSRPGPACSRSRTPSGSPARSTRATAS